MSKAASQLLDREVWSSCPLLPATRWDWAGELILHALIWMDPALVSPSRAPTGPDTAFLTLSLRQELPLPWTLVGAELAGVVKPATESQGSPQSVFLSSHPFMNGGSGFGG